jgi:hypothetical protein
LFSGDLEVSPDTEQKIIDSKKTSAEKPGQKTLAGNIRLK